MGEPVAPLAKTGLGRQNMGREFDSATTGLEAVSFENATDSNTAQSGPQRLKARPPQTTAEATSDEDYFSHKMDGDADRPQQTFKFETPHTRERDRPVTLSTS